MSLNGKQQQKKILESLFGRAQLDFSSHLIRSSNSHIDRVAGEGAGLTRQIIFILYLLQT